MKRVGVKYEGTEGLSIWHSATVEIHEFLNTCRGEAKCPRGIGWS